MEKVDNLVVKDQLPGLEMIPKGTVFEWRKFGVNGNEYMATFNGKEYTIDDSYLAVCGSSFEKVKKEKGERIDNAKKK